MRPFRLFAATGDAVARVDSADGASLTCAVSLGGSGAQCVAVDPRDPRRAFVGTFDNGVYRTRDGGATWAPVGADLPYRRVLSVAVSPSDRARGQSVVYIGTEPSNLYRSEDDGETWQPFPQLPALPSAPTWSFPPRPWTHHVRWIALHPSDPRLLFVGIELGGVMCSRDGGETWEDRKPGSYHDSHALATHPAAPGRVYEAAGGGVACSGDAGASWAPVDEGMDRHYVWGLAIDAEDPDLWYVSASHGARYAHHNDGEAQGVIYRKQGGAPWRALGGAGTGLARPLPYMPYALLTPRGRPKALMAGMQNGDLYLTEDSGEMWRQLPVHLPHLLAMSEAVIEGA